LALREGAKSLPRAGFTMMPKLGFDTMMGKFPQEDRNRERDRVSSARKSAFG
jgi:hypothetical protein